MFWYYIGVPLLLALVYFFYKVIPLYLKWLDLKKIPGPECGFWIGQFMAIQKEPFMDPLIRWWKDVGHEAKLLRYSKQMGDHMITVFDPEIIKEILMAPVHKEDARFVRPYFFLPELLGKGLVTMEGPAWLHHRRLIQPAFSLSFLRESLEACVPDKVLTLVHHWIAAGEGQEIVAGIHLSALTLDVIGDAGFSYDCKGLTDIERWTDKAQKQKDLQTTVPELTDPLITSLNAFLKPDLFRVCLYILGLGRLDNLVNTKTVKVRAAMNNTVDEVIANAKREQQKQQSNGVAQNAKPATKSLLQLLLNAKDPEMKEDSKKPALSDLELRDEMKTFLFAGHETTSTWCTWAMFALSKFPDVQEKLYQDVMKHAPYAADSSTTSKLSLEQVENMDYLAAFLQEVLRFYPPVGMQLRTSRYEEKFAGYTIPKNTTFLIPTYLMHRHPKYWDDPETFSPERWLKNDGASEQLKNGSMDNRGFTFLPFGAGGHYCIGFRFATYEAKLIMAHIVRALRIEIAPSQRDTEHTLSTMITTRAKPGLMVVVKPRK